MRGIAVTISVAFFLVAAASVSVFLAAAAITFSIQSSTNRSTDYTRWRVQKAAACNDASH